MSKFIFLTFIFLAWAFYEMSGGQDFEPMVPTAEAEPAKKDAIQVSTRSEDAATDTTPVIAPKATQPAVTRVAFSQPNFDLRTPNEEELAAVDPAVLASFGNVVGREQEAPGAAPASGAIEVAVDNVGPDMRSVTGNRVNMRNGPGTNYSIVGRLARGDEVEVLSDPGNGWLKLRVSESGRIGWMADFLLTAAD
ncbi:SH3 domain-containing protein [Pseudooceanicola sp. MF1-13]|uniref:SH3 domain-containing protein n=1 Tax=Pseudooceanicola sp. MF1-13 TaxID=3379095 RepID=UPI003891440D